MTDFLSRSPQHGRQFKGQRAVITSECFSCAIVVGKDREGEAAVAAPMVVMVRRAVPP